MKTENLKKKQHFISQLYLRHWSHKAGKSHKVYTYMGSKIHPQLTEEIAHERYFYEIHGINEVEYEILTRDAKCVKTPYVRDLFLDIIRRCRFIGIAEEAGALQEDHQIKLYNKNTIENYYSITEDLVGTAYGKAMSGTIGDINLNDYQDILRFAIYQNGRTPKVREKVRESVEAKLKENGGRFDRWYTLSMLMTCEQLFLACIEKLYKLTIINNQTSINYITNDNPVFNMRGIDDEVIELFWPISPKHAILISPYNVSEDEKRTIKEQWLRDKNMPKYFICSTNEYDDRRVFDMNKRAWENKHRFAFALEENDLSKLISTK